MAGAVYQFDLFKDYEPNPVVEGENIFVSTAHQAMNKAIAEKTSAKKKTVWEVLTEKPTPLEDFGEKIGGARKDLYHMYKGIIVKVSADRAQKMGLSELWPIPDYQKMIDAGIEPWRVSAVRAMRDFIPNKPRSYGREDWVKTMLTAREMAVNVLNGDTQKDQFEKRMPDIMRSWNINPDVVKAHYALYQILGHQNSLIKAVSFFYPSIMDKTLRYNVKGKFFHTPENAAEAIKEQFRELEGQDVPQKDRKTKPDRFAVYRDGYYEADRYVATNYYIGISKNGHTIHIKDNFENVRSGYDYIDNHLDDLKELYEKIKDVPYEREETNLPRTVEGNPSPLENVTPEQFMKAFGFRGVEFGNWVENDKRQQDLNEAYAALKDFAYVLHVPTRALSLNGNLGLRFGSNGHGGKNTPKAHYEPLFMAINLTKRNGAGSLAHEWFHALDNYLGEKNGWSFVFENKKLNSLGEKLEDGSLYKYDPDSKHLANTFYNKNISNEVINGFAKIRHNFEKAGGIKERSAKLDRFKRKDYWSDPVEMGARSFEAYVKEKLHQIGIRNDYLVNIRSQESWEHTRFPEPNETDTNDYPYPTKEEMPELMKNFDKLFESIHTRETEKGKIEMYSRSDYRVDNTSIDENIDLTRYFKLTLNANRPNTEDDYVSALQSGELKDEYLQLQAFASEVLGLNLDYEIAAEEYHGKYEHAIESVDIPIMYGDIEKELHMTHEYDQVYINLNSEKSLDWVLWHESFHALQEHDKEMSADLTAYLEENHPITKEQIEAFKEKHHAPWMSDEICKNEMYADAFADIKTREPIMEKMAKKESGLAKRMVSYMWGVCKAAKELLKPSRDNAILTKEQLRDFEMGIVKVSEKIKNPNGKKAYKYNAQAEKILMADGSDMQEYIPTLIPGRALKPDGYTDKMVKKMDMEFANKAIKAGYKSEDVAEVLANVSPVQQGVKEWKRKLEKSSAR